MSHANAALTPRARLRIAQLVADRGWTYAAAAKMFMVAPRTAKKWADRYRAEGVAGMVDRSSRPRTCPPPTWTRWGPGNPRLSARFERPFVPVEFAGARSEGAHEPQTVAWLKDWSHAYRNPDHPVRLPSDGIPIGRECAQRLMMPLCQPWALAERVLGRSFFKVCC